MTLSFLTMGTATNVISNMSLWVEITQIVFFSILTLWIYLFQIDYFTSIGTIFVEVQMSLSFPSWFFSINASNRPFLIPTDSLNRITSHWLFLFAPDLLVCDINASYLLFLLNPYSFKINYTDILFLFYPDSFRRNDSDWLFLTHFRNASLFSLSFPFWLSE